jgi:hypothetical protein
MLRSFFPMLMLAFALSLTSQAEEPKPLMLFDGKSLDNWRIHDAGGSGTVEVKDGELIIGTGESLTGVIFTKPETLPVTNYEISLEAKRLEGMDFFCGLTFPVGDLKTCATLVCGGWGGSVTGISSIDGIDASENSTGHYRLFKDQQWYRIRLQVTPTSLKVWSNDEEIINVDTAGKKVALRPGAIEDFAPLSLTTYQTTAAIKNVKLTVLTAAAPVKAENKP